MKHIWIILFLALSACGVDGTPTPVPGTASEIETAGTDLLEGGI